MRRGLGHLGHALPNTYREVGSICSMGQAAFKVAYNPTSGTQGFDLIWKFDQGMNNVAEDMHLFGIYASSGYTYWIFFKRTSTHSSQPNKVMLRYATTSTTYELMANYDYGKDAWQETKLLSQVYTACDGATTSSVANPRSGSNYGYVGIGAQWNKTANAFSTRSNTTYKMHFRYLCFYQGTTKKFELIPCIRKSDNKVGMYDKVNGVFYSSETGTEFTIGRYV